MVIVAGFIIVDPLRRHGYLASCAEVVRQARRAPGCLDFAITPDPLDPGRVDIFERWASQQAVEAFRGNGPGNEQQDAIVSGAVYEYDAVAERRLL
ncbi:putative quinol monooxygenase [Mycobacterium gordonae]|uniref:Antibiotic biosynthesis monooxygenase n=1 Tax=Mycobacterium gordonae TaxID=1778 RepID=A0A1X1XEX8_MYCGO|nr:antibiotic biosynthesis monooxygenase [Mycobacterium gordonae]MBX9980875.1 antibiotic biosynthesis monooxygenase [Mycobacterium gordonae]MCV7006045.1 antibiotic biosynthesis monooxygenase [Mycobacterium gordonae]ODR19896.1 antibiotic biosynthesis monooxygenase [Mycobacterium gordonae]ORV97362.1 antibiotic biosynthesis monooxygenase [Mycobacterium gordonae]